MKSIFGTNTSKKNLGAKVVLSFNKKRFDATVTYSFNKDTDYQIYLSKEFVEQLKDSFIMSYMRSIEQRLRKGNKEYENRDLEKEVPFWEFLDIEFDQTAKIFTCKAHYTQETLFPELFKQFINSHILKGIENTLLNKGEFKFIKDNWKPRLELKNYLNKNNIIYYLIDSKNMLLYIGESQHTKRLSQIRRVIPDWNFFRVDFLPEWMTKGERLELERLIIRSFAALLVNEKKIHTLCISQYKLVNRKIDK